MSQLSAYPPSASATLQVRYPSTNPLVVRGDEAERLRCLLHRSGHGRITPKNSVSVGLGTEADEAPSSACMYVCGTPGVGKSLTLATVLGSTPSVWLSCSSLTTSGQVPRAVLGALGRPSTGRDPWADVASYATAPGARIVLVLDEMDMSDEAYRAFSWARLKGSRVSVIGIANKVAIPHHLGGILPDIVRFAPYTAAQLATLVRARLADAHGDDQNDPNAPLGASAIMLAAKRIAASSGDARAMLDVCREAVRDLEAIDAPMDEATRNAIAVRCVAAVLARAGGSMATVEAVRALPLQQQLVLCIIARAEQHLVEEMTADPLRILSLGALYVSYVKLCRKIGLHNNAPFQDFMAVCAEVLDTDHRLVDVLDPKSRRKLNVGTPAVSRQIRKNSRPTKGPSTLRGRVARLAVPITEIQAGVADRTLLSLIVGTEN